MIPFENTDKNNAQDNQAQIKDYFETLPAFLQENIKQSGVQIETLEDLETCVGHFMQGQ